MLSSAAIARVSQPKRISFPFANDAEPFITTSASTSLANALYSVVDPGRLLSTFVVLETFSQAPTSRAVHHVALAAKDLTRQVLKRERQSLPLFLVSLIHCSESANRRPARKTANRYFQLFCTGVVDSADENNPSQEMSSHRGSQENIELYGGASEEGYVP